MTKNNISIGKDQFINGFIYRTLFMVVTSVNALVVIKILKPEELAIWYIFMALQTLLFILNSALLPNLARQYSIGISCLGEKFNPVVFHRYTTKLYKILLLMVFVVCLLFTVTYLNYVLNIFSSDNRVLLLSWAVISLSIMLEIYFTSYECALNGHGEFKNVNFSNFIARGFLLIATFMLLLFEPPVDKLLTFCLLYLISNLIKRILITSVFNRFFKGFNVDYEIETKEYYVSSLRKVYKLVYLSLLASIGGVLIIRSGIFILPYYVPMQDVAAYGMTYQLFEIGFNLLFTLTIIAYPGWVAAYKNNSMSLSRSYHKVKLISLMLMLVGCFVIISMGPLLLNLLSIKSKLLPINLCCILMVIFLLQLNHSISGQLLTVKNDIPFAYASLCTGLGVLIASLIIIPEWKMLGAVLAIFACQLCYNNWKWPLEAKKLLGHINER